MHEIRLKHVFLLNKLEQCPQYPQFSSNLHTQFILCNCTFFQNKIIKSNLFLYLYFGLNLISPCVSKLTHGLVHDVFQELVDS